MVQWEMDLCVHQVLGDLYNKCLNIDLPQFTEQGIVDPQSTYNRENKQDLENLYKTLFVNKD